MAKKSNPIIRNPRYGGASSDVAGAHGQINTLLPTDGHRGFSGNGLGQVSAYILQAGGRQPNQIDLILVAGRLGQMPQKVPLGIVG